MDNGIKIISFSSPKGGVGRTLTLANCAEIYAEGAKWAGIDPCAVLMADFDFYAPGIHFYNFAAGDSGDIYRLQDKSLNYQQVANELDLHKIGLLFYLTTLIADIGYIRLCQRTVHSFKKNKGDRRVLLRYQREVLELLDKKIYDPLNHLIALPEKSIYILPAGSPNQAAFDKTAFDFNWNAFINDYLGLDLLDCIFYKVSTSIRSNFSEGETKPVRILLDQQGGSSIASAVNKTLADGHVLVGGFNEQNKAGLKSLLKSHQVNFRDARFHVVLNQYKFRSLLEITDPAVLMEDAPHQLFKRKDQEERLNYIKELRIPRERVFITEFIKEAIQTEYLYPRDNLSKNELVRLLISVEKDFLQETRSTSVRHATVETGTPICYLAEYAEVGGQYSGSFMGLNSLLWDFFPNCRIIGIFASHGDIAELAAKGKIRARILDRHDQPIARDAVIRDLESGFYQVIACADGPHELLVPMLDFIGFPYHVLKRLNEQDFLIKPDVHEFAATLQTSETLTSINQDYYREHVLQWEKYCLESSKINGVPLFLDFQLLVYNKRFFSSRSKLPYLFQKYANRNFEGFKNPQDILDYVSLARNKDHHLKKLLMFQHPSFYELWYEWLTIFSIFYFGDRKLQVTASTDQRRDIDGLKDFFLDNDDAIDAMMQYFKLVEWCVDAENRKKKESITEVVDSLDCEPEPVSDWNKVMKDFYEPVAETASGIIFIWPDVLPIQYRKNDNYIYQVAPSFKIFEECWLFSMVNHQEENRLSNTDRMAFMNYYLTLKGQQQYLKAGGLPVHRDILSSLDTWREYPYIPPLFEVYRHPESESKLVKNWQGIAEIAQKFFELMDDLRRQKPNREAVINAIKNWQ